MYPATTFIFFRFETSINVGSSFKGLKIHKSIPGFRKEYYVKVKNSATRCEKVMYTNEDIIRIFIVLRTENI